MKLKYISMLTIVTVLSTELIANQYCVSQTYKDRSGVTRPNRTPDGTQPESARCDCACRGPRTSYGKCIECGHIHKNNPYNKFACLLNHKKRSIA